MHSYNLEKPVYMELTALWEDMTALWEENMTTSHFRKFEKYRKREIFHRRDGCMHGFAHESRFEPFNDTTIVNTKYLKYQSPHFKKWADHSLDEYIKNPSNCAEENATH